MSYFFEVWCYTGNICHGRFTFETLAAVIEWCDDKLAKGYRCEVNRMPR